MREAQNDILSFFKIKKEHNRELLPLYINKVEATGGYALLLVAVQRNRWAVQLNGFAVQLNGLTAHARCKR